MPDRAARVLAREKAPDYANRMIEALLAKGVDLEEVRRDPLEWLRQWGEVVVFDLKTNSSTASGCEVSGVYLGQIEPPQIGIAYSDTTQRMHFTALHELGHHIQLNDDDISVALLNELDQGTALEEAACDAFAAAILIPEHIAEAHLGKTTPSAVQVARLWRNLETVSRSAVAIRAVRQIEADGLIVILDDDGNATFSASKGSPRPARFTNQSETQIWKAITQSQGDRPAEVRGRFAYSDGLAGDIFYMQAAKAGAGYVVVAASERVPWTLSVARPEWTTYGKIYHCSFPNCDSTFRAAASAECPRCRQAPCPDCSRCECSATTRSEFTCSACFMIKNSALASGDPPVCSDCA